MPTTMFEVQLVNSTAIRLIAFSETVNTLRIIFRNGSAYDYANFPSQLYSELLEAESVGQFFGLIRRTYIGERINPTHATDFLLRVLEASQGQRLLIAG